MSNIIEIRNLGKRYQLGQFGARTFRDEIERLFQGEKLKRDTQNTREFWALRDTTFDVAEGEILGIIGTNGAGKSTLLKLLSRITAPTEGSFTMKGHAASLLEVGTGFHPELTGRENVFLNGAILGMKRRDIAAVFDEIVDFAELPSFIDTPVKRYSSGMYVRLAFAVAAHLQPEILIIDEVLAVGDARFQQKCLGKMRDVAMSGRTILFVSHNSAAIEQLCDRVVWLKDGRVNDDGPSSVVISNYLRHFTQSESQVKGVSQDGQIIVKTFELLNSKGEVTADFTPGEPLTMELVLEARRPLEHPRVSLWVSHNNDILFGAHHALDGLHPESVEGEWRVRCQFPILPLLARQDFELGASLREGNPPKMLIKGLSIPFHTIGNAKSMGWQGQHAEFFLPGTAPVTVPYQWEINGTPSPVMDISGIFQAGEGLTIE